MKSLAFLSMADLAGYVIDDELAVAPLAALGYAVESVPWREPTDWDRFAAVVVRTPWDYPESPLAFVEVLEAIENSSAQLANPLPLIRWNLNKTYLRDLERRGVTIVPTAWSERYDRAALMACFDRFSTHELVVKPVVGANAEGTFRIAPNMSDDDLAPIQRRFAQRPYMTQPLIRSVLDVGEFSLFFLGGEFSHAILKKPASGDFRVQEEHGGEITAHTPEPRLRAYADQLLATVEPAPLYARADVVRAEDGAYLLMELEVIEPSLYLRMDPQAPERFAKAIATWLDGA